MQVVELIVQRWASKKLFAFIALLYFANSMLEKGLISEASWSDLMSTVAVIYLGGQSLLDMAQGAAKGGRIKRLLGIRTRKPVRAKAKGDDDVEDLPTME